MTYKKHAWKKGEKITSELLNNLEVGISEAKKGIEENLKALNALVGLEGEAEEIKPLGKKAQLSDLTDKINELIGVLQRRGVLSK